MSLEKTEVLKALKEKKEKEEKLNRLKNDMFKAAKGYNKYITQSFVDKLNIRTLIRFVHPTDQEEFHKRMYAIY
jgi:hypothetical protein